MRYQLVSEHSDGQRRTFLLEVFVTTSASSDSVYLCNECKMHSYRVETRTWIHKDEDLTPEEHEGLACAEYTLGLVVPRLPIASVLRVVGGSFHLRLHPSTSAPQWLWWSIDSRRRMRAPHFDVRDAV